MTNDLCNCGDALGEATVPMVSNRPGLSSIQYRVGTFSSFREAMLDRIAKAPELVNLRTRDADDYAITILECWAAVADVLTFYQERYVNETFLRTAQMTDAVQRMARMIGYELSPGASATVWLAFLADEQSTIPERLRVQSVPDDTSPTPIKFETLESIIARPGLSDVRIFPRPVGINPLRRGASKAFIIPGEDGLALSSEFAAGDRLVIFNTASNDVAWEVIEIAQKSVVEDRVSLRWTQPIAGRHWDLGSFVYKQGRRFRLFGVNAPTTYMVPTRNGETIEWSLSDNGEPPYTDDGAGTSSVLKLDALFDDLSIGMTLLVVCEDHPPEVVTVVGVREGIDNVGPLSDTITMLEVTPKIASLDQSVRSKVTICELIGSRLRLWGYEYADQLALNTVLVPGRDADDESIEIGAIIEGTEFSGGSRIQIDEIEVGRKVIAVDDVGEAVPATIAEASIAGAAPAVAVTADDTTSASELKWDDQNAETIWGVVSGSWAPVLPSTNDAVLQITVTIGGSGPFTLQLSESNLENVSVAASALQQLVVAATSSDSFTQAVVAHSNDRIIVFPGESGLSVQFGATDEDSTTVKEMGLDDDQLRPICGLRSGEFDTGQISLSKTQPQVQIRIGAVGPLCIELDSGSGTFSLDTMQTQLQEKIRSADLSPSFSKAAVLQSGQRLILLAGPVGDPWVEYLRLDLITTNSAGIELDAATSRLLGNIAEASHGETIADEVVGHGDSTAAFPRYSLKKSALTHLATATSPEPESTLQLLVNGAKWKQVSTLFDAGPNDEVYKVSINDKQEASILFGGLGEGAVPPTGRGNIIATYRQGVGLEGRVAAKAVRTLLDRPQGLGSVTNPLPSEGGADPESADDARETAPTTVRTFGRAISRRDYEDLVLSGGEVAKAQATWVWYRQRRAIHLTVAAQEGATFSDEKLNSIQEGLNAARDLNQPLLIANYLGVAVTVEATIQVLDTYLADDVQTAAREALVTALSFEQMRFGQPVYLSNMYSILQGVKGVSYVDVDALFLKRPADMSKASFENMLIQRGVDRHPDGTPLKLQPNIPIFSARPQTSPLIGVWAAELAVIEDATRDLVLNTSGGLTS